MVVEYIDSGFCCHKKKWRTQCKRCKSLPLKDTCSAEIIEVHSIQKLHFWMRGEVAISRKKFQWWRCLPVKNPSAAVTFRWHKCQKCLQCIKKF